MRKLNEELFFADYDRLVMERDDKIALKDNVIESEKARAEEVVAVNGYSEAVRNVLVAEIVAEKEREFDTAEIDEKIAKFETYIEEVEDEVVEEPEVVPEGENLVEEAH